MRWLLGNVAGGIVRWTVATIISAVCLMLGFAPAQWLAAIIGEPPDWLVHPLTRLAIILMGVVVVGAILLYRGIKKTPTAKLTYLSAHRDYDLGPAIIEMAHRSAWGKWFAARELVNASKPIDERYWLQTAASVVMDKMRDGELVIRGRLYGQTGSKPIPQTDWRDVALYYFPDNRALWRLRILPLEGVTIQDGDVIDTDLSLETVEHITQYESLLVDAHQFERLWPATDAVADKQRHQFLREAKKRKLAADAIKALAE